MNFFSLFLSMLFIIGSVEYSSAELIFYFGLRPIFIAVDVVTGAAGRGPYWVCTFYLVEVVVVAVKVL